MKENTIELLKAQGWYEGRCVDVSEDIEILRNRGYTILDTFIEFQQEFIDIEIQCVVNQAERDFSFMTYMIPVQGFITDQVIINDYPGITGSAVLNPIGDINGSVDVVIDEKGIIYSLYDGSVRRIGTNAKEAIDNLCNLSWKEFFEYPFPPWD